MHSEWLLHQTAQYNAISSQFETKYIYETYKTDTPFGSNIVSVPDLVFFSVPYFLNKLLQIVPKFSAVIPGAVNAEEIAINKNHVGMVRFHSDTDEGFKKISLILGLMVSEAAPRIENKLRLHDAQRRMEPTVAFNGPERINLTQHEISHTRTRMFSIGAPSTAVGRIQERDF